jgi:hypothetical protein
MDYPQQNQFETMLPIVYLDKLTEARATHPMQRNFFNRTSAAFKRLAFLELSQNSGHASNLPSNHDLNE